MFMFLRPRRPVKQETRVHDYEFSLFPVLAGQADAGHPELRTLKTEHQIPSTRWRFFAAGIVTMELTRQVSSINLPP